MKTQHSLWFPIAVALFVGCSAAGPANPYDDEDGFGAEAEDEAEAAAEDEGEDVGEPAPGTGDDLPNPGGDTGDPPLPDTVVGTVCYPGANGANDACVPLVDWSSSWGSSYSYPSHSSSQYRKPLRFVDLGAADASLMVSKNFKLGEVMQEWKGRYGIFQPHVVEKIQQLRDMTGGAIYINSAYRSPGYNGSVDGATFSRHMFGDAVDMRSGAVSLSTLKSKCQQLNAGYIGTYTTFVHCDWRNHSLDAKFFSSGTISLPSGEEIESTMPEHTAEVVLLEDGLTFAAPATGFDEGEPLRTWTAYDSAENVIETIDVTEYIPPEDAVRVHVEIGGNVELEFDL
ncbi:MAG: DUF882 domain-containing protein [Deltaproteobacteria bacterium]|jgi:hypothetical protein|nr:DUF882 domain-containing protein [Deltaproteobacteria bacterium]MBW2531639.1 DUF882 domain-containing protein [Deltaproteobacteria bacterium]